MIKDFTVIVNIYRIHYFAALSVHFLYIFILYGLYRSLLKSGPRTMIVEVGRVMPL